MDAPALPCLKGRYPFSLCAPSFLYPAGYAFNVERLRRVVDEVELLFFESDERCGLPTADEISRIAELAAPAGLKLNVHLPLDIDVGSADPRVRDHATRTITRVIELAAPLAPATFILHAPRDGRAGDAAAGIPVPAGNPEPWRARVRQALALLPEPRSRFAVETLDWDLRDAADIIRDLGFSVCIDIGHLLLAGRDIAAFFDAFRGSITMVHLHGVQGRQDHLPLSVMERGALARIGSILRDERYGGSLCLEVFSVDGFLASLPGLEEMMRW